VIHIFFGGDDFTLTAALKRMKEATGPDAVREANVQEFEVAETSLGQLQAALTTVPFLAERRLVILRGLLGRFERRGGSRRGGQREAQSNQGQEWQGLVEMVNSLPQSTDLVLVDGRLSKGNPLLRRLAPLAQVREFPPLRGEALRRWVMELVGQKSGAITPAGVRLLCDLVDGNLWTMEGELEKLTLYCGARPIQEEDVRALVAVAREANIYAAVDALLEGRREIATQLTEQLLAGGTGAQHILAILARQLRQLVLARELLAGGATPQAVGQRLGIPSDFLLRKTVEQARRHPLEALRVLYRRLVEMDMATKMGSMDENLGLQLLLATAAGEN